MRPFAGVYHKPGRQREVWDEVEEDVLVYFNDNSSTKTRACWKLVQKDLSHENTKTESGQPCRFPSSSGIFVVFEKHNQNPDFSSILLSIDGATFTREGVFNFRTNVGGRNPRANQVHHFQ